jgi:nitrate/nitrite transporter NarK
VRWFIRVLLICLPSNRLRPEVHNERDPDGDPVDSTALLAMLSLALVQAGNGGFIVNFWPACHMVVGKKTIAKTTSLINSGTHAGSILAPIYFGWAKDSTGSIHQGLYMRIAVLALNFAIMNVFFVRHKAPRKKLAATESAS